MTFRTTILPLKQPIKLLYDFFSVSGFWSQYDHKCDVISDILTGTKLLRCLLLLQPVVKGVRNQIFLDNGLKSCMKNYASLCSYLVILLSLVLVIYWRWSRATGYWDQRITLRGGGRWGNYFLCKQITCLNQKLSEVLLPIWFDLVQTSTEKQ